MNIIPMAATRFGQSRSRFKVHQTVSSMFSALEFIQKVVDIFNEKFIWLFP